MIEFMDSQIMMQKQGIQMYEKMKNQALAQQSRQALQSLENQRCEAQKELASLSDRISEESNVQTKSITDMLSSTLQQVTKSVLHIQKQISNVMKKNEHKKTDTPSSSCKLNSERLAARYEVETQTYQSIEALAAPGPGLLQNLKQVKQVFAISDSQIAIKCGKNLLYVMKQNSKKPDARLKQINDNEITCVTASAEHIFVGLSAPEAKLVVYSKARLTEAPVKIFDLN